MATPSDERVRPTTDRAREALFSIIQSKFDSDLQNCDVLDIFSGTGAFGLEAASRGAKSVTFVDVDLRLTEKNAKLCGFDNLSFIRKDARFLPQARKKYDLIFLDAPYNMGFPWNPRMCQFRYICLLSCSAPEASGCPLSRMYRM